MIYNRENPTQIWNQTKLLLHLYFDTMADFPNLPGLDAIAPGSDAFCIDTGDAYILSGAGIWEVL